MVQAHANLYSERREMLREGFVKSNLITVINDLGRK